ncbi:hypothetical protein KDI_23300 [Dictyobacter arantiisoli]|uniref:Uncharacterized protein n=1 Tax=Dictyobacter arantiisoli TaxID=2014874 RepID=A0A5A5TC94_9CHLR|nr:hypothetical protein KDI_23300 [Dictyobacter arantiisoli]
MRSKSCQTHISGRSIASNRARARSNMTALCGEPDWKSNPSYAGKERESPKESPEQPVEISAKRYKIDLQAPEGDTEQTVPSG